MLIGVGRDDYGVAKIKIGVREDDWRIKGSRERPPRMLSRAQMRLSACRIPKMPQH